MNSLLKICGIFLFSVLAGGVINHFNPQGIKWYHLVPEKYVVFSAQFISAESARSLAMEQNCIFVDMRDSLDFDLDHIPGAIYLPADKWDRLEIPGNLENVRKVILYNQEGDGIGLRRRSLVVADKFQQPVYILYGGYLAWLESGFPTEGEKLYEY